MSDAYGRDQQSKAQEEQVAPDEVVITIKGPKAARMIDHTASEARIKEAIISALGPTLKGIEEAAAQRAADHASLRQLVQDLHVKDAQPNEEVIRLQEEIKRLREDHSYRFCILQDKVRNLEAAAAQAAAQPPATERQAVAPEATRVHEGGAEPPAKPNGALRGGWLRTLNTSLGLWSAVTGITLAATAVSAAFWIYG